jgi:two-component system, OmpR family, sensor histidine kinase CiaH
MNMFGKLRLRLTLINITVVGLILVVVFAGIYFLMERTVSAQSQQMMRSVLQEERLRLPRRPILPNQRQWGNYIYVKLDAAGEIMEIMPDETLSGTELESLVNKAMMTEDDKGILVQEGENYRFLKGPLRGRLGTGIVFMDTRFENNISSVTMTVFAIISVVALALVFFSSLFLANRALIPIRAAWERQRNFVADASHELRTPLAVIQTNLELVMGNQEETVESQEKWLENIRAENRRMAKLVEDLLLLARADSNQELLKKELFSMNQALREAIAPLEPIAGRKGIQLEVTQDDDMQCHGDEQRIKQVIVILVDNAIKYTPAQGNVSVELLRKAGGIELSVSDTGEGIDEEHLPRIFERFYRADKARSRECGGTGLGLAIAQWIIREHRGTILVSSAAGKGSTFKVTLPVY